MEWMTMMLIFLLDTETYVDLSLNWELASVQYYVMHICVARESGAVGRDGVTHACSLS